MIFHKIQTNNLSRINPWLGKYFREGDKMVASGPQNINYNMQFPHMSFTALFEISQHYQKRIWRFGESRFNQRDNDIYVLGRLDLIAYVLYVAHNPEPYLNQAAPTAFYPYNGDDLRYWVMHHVEVVRMYAQPGWPSHIYLAHYTDVPEREIVISLDAPGKSPYLSVL